MIVSARFMNLVSALAPGRMDGITLWPFIVVRRAPGPRLLRHEEIHLAQQRELLIVPFYALYLAMFLAGLARRKRPWQAYRDIPFEREAYDHEKDPGYLASRRRFAWASPRFWV